MAGKVATTKYLRSKFSKWKDRVNQHIPQIAIKLYASKISGDYIPADIQKLLGGVIRNINDPFATFGEGRDSEIAMECIIELEVEKLFKYAGDKGWLTKTLKAKISLTNNPHQ